MGTDYRLFSKIEYNGEPYYSDIEEKVCPLESLFLKKITASSRMKVWLQGEPSMGKTLSTLLLKQRLDREGVECYRFSAKKLNYDQLGADGDQSHYLTCMDSIEKLSDGAIVIIDGLDELRYEAVILERARTCIRCATEKCNVLVVSRQDDGTFATFLKEFDIAQMCTLTNQQVSEYVGKANLLDDVISNPLLHIVLFLKIYRTLILSGAVILAEQLSESRLLEEYFTHLYREKGNIQEIESRRINEFYRDINQIGECIFEDVRQTDIYLGNTEWNGKFKLHNIGGVPKLLNNIFEETSIGSIDADNIKFLDFALGEYICSRILLLWERYSLSEAKEFVLKCQEFANVTTARMATNGFYYAGEIIAIREEQNSEIGDLMKAIHEQVFVVAQTPNLFSLCCGYSDDYLDDIYGVGYARSQMEQDKKESKEWLLARRNHIQEWIAIKNEGRYEGETENGLPDGVGTMRYSETTFYKGSFHQGKRQGHGEMHYPDGSIYVGNWNNDSKEGQGRLSFPDGTYYDCEWHNNTKNGWGIFYSPANERKYEGFFKDGKFDGFGKETIPGVMSYCGYQVDGKYHGLGCFEHFEHGEHFIYCGEYEHGYWQGHGVLYYQNSSYQGEFSKCYREGYGVQTLPNGDRYEGYWKNDRYWGHGRYFIFESDIWLEGEFVDDKRVGKFVVHYPDGSVEEELFDE